MRFRSTVVATAMSMFVVLACSSSGWAPDLVHVTGGDHTSEADNAINAAIPWPLGVPFSTAAGVYVCSITPVRIDSVTLHEPSANMRLLDWGITPAPPTAGDVRGPLRNIGVRTSHRLRQPCAADQTWAALVVELERTTGSSATVFGFDLHYRSFGRARSRFVQFGIALCNTQDLGPTRSAARCDGSG
ncbi:MAG: hypothetical protein ACRDVG_13075 [Jatrophihabitantaceae bacterium]